MRTAQSLVINMRGKDPRGAVLVAGLTEVVSPMGNFADNNGCTGVAFGCPRLLRVAHLLLFHTAAAGAITDTKG